MDQCRRRFVAGPHPMRSLSPAERVRVFLRVRPSKAEGETPGALRLKAGGGGVVVYRE